ncbi:hypothetical protein AJ78_08423 [Emergomyces pasteurianus Ep9510]|uniref:Uncharacterized protein n=1 Tax=Emergomyces pasteurianus Ep9510 TaxID=1447872 RepID=A0A1J9Q3V0_9EURO|nr:hypothetical protein AJ78_08423 [Emergomyces pasteurianus Ep9510]
MSTTPEVVAKKRGRPKKVVAAAEIESSATAPASKKTKSATATPSTGKKSISTTTRTPRKSSPKTSPTAASELKAATIAPIDQKPAVKKGSPLQLKKTPTISPDPAQETSNSPSAPSKTLDDDKKAKSDPAHLKPRPRASVLNPSVEQSIEPQSASADSISNSESAELPENLKTIGKKQPEANNNTSQAAGEISESFTKSTGGGGTIELDQVTQQTQTRRQTTPQISVAAAAVQGSKILNALAASSQSAVSTTSAQDKIKKSSRPIERSPVLATAEMPAPAHKKVSPSSSRQPPSQPPPITPPRKQATPRETQRLKPQRPAEHPPSVKPQDIRNTKQYKTLARRWTSAMVALPILLYTSYALYERVFADKAPRGLPGTNNFPQGNDSSHSSSPSSTLSSSTPSSGSTTTTNQNNSTI